LNVVVVLLQFIDEAAFHEGGDFSACLKQNIPPCPSKTANRACYAFFSFGLQM
jgi:hypothetical protein